jgi:hypothetical protein
MDQRTAGPLASRVRYAGLRPPLTPTARQPESCITHSKFKRGPAYDEAALPENQKTRKPENQKTRKPENQKTRKPENQKTGNLGLSLISLRCRGRLAILASAGR